MQANLKMFPILLLFFIFDFLKRVDGSCIEPGKKPRFTSSPVVTQVDVGSVEVSWGGLLENKDCADQLNIKYYPVESPSMFQLSELLSTDTNSHVIKDLIPNEEYMFQVNAREDRGILGVEYHKSPKTSFTISNSFMTTTSMPQFSPESITTSTSECQDKGHPGQPAYSKIMDFAKEKGLDATLLHFAIEANDTEIFNEIMKIPAIDVNSPYVGDGRTPLMMAIEVGNDEIFHALLGNDDIDVNASNDKYLTPFMYAAEKNEGRYVEVLMSDDRVQVNLKDELGETAFHKIANRGYNDLAITMMQNRRVDPTIQNKKGISPLCYLGMLRYYSYHHYEQPNCP